ncbi:MAG: P-II family nitrogen regulator [Brevinematales bacterium]|nr:P-II family nitrogen regulator [Brevinematales bacterium]
MKYIIAIIRPEKLDEVKEALRMIDVSRMTVTEVQGYGRQRGYLDEAMGIDKGIRFVRKVKLEIAVNDEFVEPTVNTLLKVARSEGDGRIGDGKIFILPLEDVIRIRTGERGREAI